MVFPLKQVVVTTMSLAPPDNLLDWINDTGSLTLRLKRALSIEQIDVFLLKHEFDEVYDFEWEELEVSKSERMLVREIFLGFFSSENFRPLVFARSIIPESSMQSGNESLKHLGAESLGQILFTSPSMKREQPVASCLQQPHDIYKSVQKRLPYLPKNLWGRRSVFSMNDKPLLVQEYFLPLFCELIEKTQLAELTQ